MSDLISREALKREFETLFYNDCGDFVRTERLIDDAPTVEERPKGKHIVYFCGDGNYPNCPYCLADMRGDV